MPRWLLRALVVSLTLGGSGLAAPSAPSTPAAGEEDDLAARRSIRGRSVEPELESAELRELRRFEEESFPRAFPGLPTPAEARGEEGPAPPLAVEGDTGAHDATAGLRSPPRSRIDPESDAAPAPQLALPWLAALQQPDMPVRYDARVLRYLEFYRTDRRGRSIMTSWLRSQGRYRTMIEAALRRARLPQSLLYVAMIESSYDPHDRSHAGAVGVWQFMPENSRIYGLRVDHWVDERKDPERSTEAVTRYLADLQGRFGSWHLALAAFNAGYGALLRSITKYNSNDYWDLCRYENGLPWETTLYVPKVLAAAIVGENRAAFGYDKVVADPPVAYDRVVVPTSMSFDRMALAAGVKREEIALLNPELRRGRTPPEAEGWTARVPAGSGPRFAASFEHHRERLAVRVVRFGERLDELARLSGASLRELKKINGILDLADVRVGMPLLLPEGRKPLPPPPDEQGPLVVAVTDKDAPPPRPGDRRVFYRVLPGDRLGEIASFFHVAAGDIARWNRLDADAELTSRMVLEVWVGKEVDISRAALLDPAQLRVVTVGSGEFFDLMEAKKGRKRITYVVRTGDTLKKIAARFHLKEADLERINRFGRKTDLRVGQPLTVYVAMTEAERSVAERKLRGRPAPERLDDEEDSGPAEEREATPSTEPQPQTTAPPAPPHEARIAEPTL